MELIFSVWIAAAYKDHSLHLCIPSTDGKSERIRVGFFLCWAFPVSGNTQRRVFLSQKLPLGHHLSQLPLALFQFIQFPFEIICILGFHNILTWRSTQYPHRLLGVTCYLVILLIVPFIIWSVLWETVTKQSKHSLLWECYRLFSVKTFRWASPFFQFTFLPVSTPLLMQCHKDALFLIWFPRQQNISFTNGVVRRSLGLVGSGTRREDANPQLPTLSWYQPHQHCWAWASRGKHCLIPSILCTLLG